VILLDEFTDSAEITAYILVFELDPSLREVGFCRIARRSSRLAKEDHTFAVHTAMRLPDQRKGGIKQLEFESHRTRFDGSDPGQITVQQLPLLKSHSVNVLDLEADLGRLLQHG
jgi:hypothetical protein